MLKIAKRMFHAAVVGSGPAGFYSAQELLAVGATRVDLIERLPQPFGLVRTGIAPDHANDKRVAADFAALLRDEPRLRFFGNVNVASDNNSNNVQFNSAARVSFDQLRRDYPVVVLALGSQRDRMLGVDGERTLRGVYSARTFAAWYNSSPLAQQLPFADELRRAKSVAIVGNGNVALDVARLLCKDRDELSDTDISPTALEALRRSSVRDVHIIGRRGLIHASFTNRELREILSLPGCNINVKLDEPLSDADVALMNSTRQGKRQLPLWRAAIDTPQHSATNQYSITFHFWRSVARLHADASGASLGGVELARNRLGDGGGVIETSEKHESLADVSLLFRSIGFDADPCSAALPIGRNGAVENDSGRVRGLSGVYVCGWLKRGPSGIVGTNKFDAAETAATVAQDVESGAIKASLPGAASTCLDNISNAVTNVGWFAIQAAEERRGRKITSSQEMVQLASAAAGGVSTGGASAI